MPASAPMGTSQYVWMAKRRRTRKLPAASTAAKPSNPPPSGNSTRLAKKTARFAITPTTAAVTPVSAAWSRRLPLSHSM